MKEFLLTTLLFLAGVGIMFVGMYVWTPLFYVGFSIMIIAAILWDPFNFFR